MKKILNGTACVFLFLVFLYAANNFYLIKEYYSSFLYSDEAMHLDNSLEYLRILRDFSPDVLHRLLQFNYTYPPLFYLVATVAAACAGFSKLNLVMINIFFLMILLVSTYLIGKKISNDKSTAVFSVFVLAMFPMVFGMSRVFLLDFSLMSMVALNICCLLFVEGFTNRRMSVLFGAVSGAAMLTKWTALFFVAGPLCDVIVRSFRKNTTDRRRLWFNLGLALMVMALVSFWYVYRFCASLPLSNLVETLRGGNVRMSSFQYCWHSFGGASYYLRTLFPGQISWLFSLIFPLSLYFFIRSNIKYKGVVLLWTVLPYVLLTLVDNKWPRYMMPALPAIALVIGVGIHQAGLGRAKSFVCLFLMVMGLVQYFLVSYVPREKVPSFVGSLFYVKVKIHPDVDLYSLGYFHQIDRKPFDNLSEVIREADIYGKRNLPAGPVNVGLLWLNQEYRARYVSAINNLNLSIYSFYENPMQFKRIINDLDVIVLATGSGEWPTRQEVMEEGNKINLGERLQLTDRHYAILGAALEKLKTEFVPLHRYDAFQNVSVVMLVRKKTEDAPSRKKSISGGPLALMYDRGEFNIYYKGRKLTKDEGASLFIKSDGIIYSSRDMIWDFKRIRENHLIAHGESPDFFISQDAEFEIEDERVIHWKTRTAFRPGVRVEQEAAALILQDDYDHYMIPRDSTKRAFPKTHINLFETKDFYRERIKQGQEIGVTDNIGNEVALDCTAREGDEYLISSSASNRHYAKALICYKTSVTARAGRDGILTSDCNIRINQRE